MRVAILSNVNLDLVVRALKSPAETWSPAGYGEWVVHTYQQDTSELALFAPDQIVVLLDGTALLDGVDDDDVERELADQLEHIERLANSFSSSRVLINTLDLPARRIRSAAEGCPEERWAGQWRAALLDVVQRVPNVSVFDLGRMVSDLGRATFYSPKMWYLGGQPYSMSATKLLAAALDDNLLQPGRTRKKVMVVDLDNTVWGGVVGEDGPESLVIGPSGAGAAYRDVQRRLKELAATGVLLAAVSKNEPDDARAGFEQNRHMVLTPDDFVAIVASWDPKPQSITALAETLNLGLDSFVFLDDNPVEREAVRQALPEVTVLDFPRDTAGLPQVIRDAAATHFWIERLTSEDASKVGLYRQEAARSEFREAAATMDDYLRQLDVRVLIAEMDESTTSRTAQLTQKTNQFNVRTRRYSVEELTRRAQEPGRHTFVVSTTDRFGDAGQVAVVMVDIDGDRAVIDNLLMSCRVMGRAIEDSMLAAIEERLAASGVRWIEAAWVASPRNTPVQDLFDRLGFERVTESPDHVTYRRDVGSPAPDRRDLHAIVWPAR